MMKKTKNQTDGFMEKSDKTMSQLCAHSTSRLNFQMIGNENRKGEIRIRGFLQLFPEAIVGL